MNNLKDIVNDFNFKVRKCSYCNNARILDTDKGRFIVKKRKHHNDELFHYLQAKNFNNFINIYNNNSKYEIYPFVEEVTVTPEEKALDIIYLISILHNKTTFYKTTEIDTLKNIYEDINHKLIYLSHYYDNLKIIVEENNYMSPSGYLLLRNSSIIFRAIEESKYFIDKWYEKAKNKKNYRVSTIHNNLELDHLIKSDTTYLISWDNSCKASPIYDLLSLYKNTYDKVEFSSLFEVYNSKYPLFEEELYLLFALLLVPNKIDLSNREIINTKEVYELTNYLILTTNFVSKYHSNSSDNKTH